VSSVADDSRNTNPTIFHEFQRPEYGADWAHAWDHLVERVDAELRLSGQVDDRPHASNAPDGSVFEAIDQDILYRTKNGSQWRAVGGVGSSSSPLPEVYADTFAGGSIETGSFNPSKVRLEP